MGILLPENLCYYDRFIAYDFEELFKQINKETQKTTFTNKHIPVSYALCDDVGHTRSHVSDDPKQLIQNFIKDLLTLRKEIVLELTEDYRQVFAQANLDDLEQNDPCAGIDQAENPVDYRLAELSKSWAKQWVKRLYQIKN